MSITKQAERMFEDNSSYRSSYREWPKSQEFWNALKPASNIEKPKKIDKSINKEYRLKDTCTMSELRYELPFTLFNKSDIITSASYDIMTHPIRSHSIKQICFPNEKGTVSKLQVCKREEDLHHLLMECERNATPELSDHKVEPEVRRNRPRLLISPALSLDDIEDESMRNGLMKDFYYSVTHKSLKEGVPVSMSRLESPLPGRLMPAEPLKLAKDVPLYVSPQWRMETVTWEGRQMRSHLDASKRFWLNYPLPKCTACDQYAIVRARRLACCNSRKYSGTRC